jgi:hypothetical protein
MTNTFADRALLLIDDSLDDYHTTVFSLRKAGVENVVHGCDSGEAALDIRAIKR